jgi:hypothetical protein
MDGSPLTPSCYLPLPAGHCNRDLCDFCHFAESSCPMGTTMLAGAFIGAVAIGVVLALLICMCWRCGWCLVGDAPEAKKESRKVPSYRPVRQDDV